jgi:hypothetical protein
MTAPIILEDQWTFGLEIPNSRESFGTLQPSLYMVSSHHAHHSHAADVRPDIQARVLLKETFRNGQK